MRHNNHQPRREEQFQIDDEGHGLTSYLLARGAMAANGVTAQTEAQHNPGDLTVQDLSAQPSVMTMVC
jgi:hypothetical protein